MIAEIDLTAKRIVGFLGTVLPMLGDKWWDTHVVDSLTHHQQRLIEERRITELKQLDFAALLRVVDQNWFEISNKQKLPREGRNWIKEAQSVRNKWAHASTEAMPASEIYRDLDTLYRLLVLLGASDDEKKPLEAKRTQALSEMSAALGNAQPTGNIAPLEAETPPESQSVQSSAFAIGELVALVSDPSTQMPILDILLGGPEKRYVVFKDGKKSTLYESQLAKSKIKSEEPETTSSGDLQASISALYVLSPSSSNLMSIGSGRVNYVPYQYRPVLKLIKADRPRLLIADEVGVGKTIEAGLILKELRARVDVNSVLVICPKALVAERKWFNEMKRFDETFTSLDGRSLRHCLSECDLEGEWPEDYSKAILPFSLFDSDLVYGGEGRGRRRKRKNGILDLDPPPQFDLVIVDEAHHLRNRDTYLHQGVKFLCDNAKAVVLLTATPVQLGSEDLFTLLNIVRPDLIIDKASFEQMAEPNPHINAAVQNCRSAGSGWNVEARDNLEKAADTDWGRKFLRESPDFQSVFDELRIDNPSDETRVVLTRAIEELYTFSPIINRTRRRDVGEFTTRKPETIEVPFTSEQRALHDGLLDVIAKILVRCHGQQNVRFMMTTIRRQAASCLYGLAPLLSDLLARKLNALEVLEASDGDFDENFDFVDQIRGEISELVERAESLDPYDKKVEAFVQALTDKQQMQNNKALVFSTFRHTLSYLAEKTALTGIRFGLIHGDIPDDERSALRQRFSLPKENDDAIDVLLSSEVGCEGLDFQFCDLLINYDVPWNPMKVEQRIGRLDRYGQKSDAVAILNFITPGTVDADIYSRCLWRIGVFQNAVGGSEEILGEVTRELHDIADSFDLTVAEREERLQQLADNSVRKVREEMKLEQEQTQLFGLNVPGGSWRDEIEASRSIWLTPKYLEQCVRHYLEQRLGTDGSYLSGEHGLKNLRLSSTARADLLEDYNRLPKAVGAEARLWEKWLRGPQPNLAITFEQEAAVANPKAVHCTVTHPLVRRAAQSLEIFEAKFCALEVNCSDFPTGDHPFAVYRWARKGIRADEELVAVTKDKQVEARLLELLSSARDCTDASASNGGERDSLDSLHYRKWADARGNHIAKNKEFADHRLQSLTASHAARVAATEDQIERTTNAKILLMKRSELLRAEADFERRKTDIGIAASSGDIVSEAILFGTLKISSEDY